MRPEFFAILSAMGWSVDSILVRKGSRFSNIFSAAFLSYVVTAALLWTYSVLSFPLDLVWSPASIYFVLSGLIQPLLARILFYTGIARLGVARAAPLRGTSPLFATIIAVVFLAERPGVVVYTGTVLTVAGVWLISARQAQEKEWRLFDVIFPVGAALLAAVSQNLRRTGLLILNNPFVASAITTSTSLVVFLISLIIMRKSRLLWPSRRSLPFFGGSAVVSAVSQLLVFVSLSHGEVSVMVPLFSLTPLFSVSFSFLFLGDQEKVTSKIAVGALLLVGGVVLITSR